MYWVHSCRAVVQHGSCYNSLDFEVERQTVELEQFFELD